MMITVSRDDVLAPPSGFGSAVPDAIAATGRHTPIAAVPGPGGGAEAIDLPARGRGTIGIDVVVTGAAVREDDAARAFRPILAVGAASVDTLGHGGCAGAPGCATDIAANASGDLGRDRCDPVVVPPPRAVSIDLGPGVPWLGGGRCIAADPLDACGPTAADRALIDLDELAVVGETVAILGRLRRFASSDFAAAEAADLGFASILVVLDHFLQHPGAITRPSET